MIIVCLLIKHTIKKHLNRFCDKIIRRNTRRKKETAENGRRREEDLISLL